MDYIYYPNTIENEISHKAKDCGATDNIPIFFELKKTQLGGKNKKIILYKNGGSKNFPKQNATMIKKHNLKKTLKT